MTSPRLLVVALGALLAGFGFAQLVHLALGAVLALP